MIKEYTIVNTKTDKKDGKTYAICYYWENNVRKFDKIEITPANHYFYSSFPEKFDRSLFQKSSGYIDIFGKSVYRIIPNKIITYDEFKALQNEYGNFSRELDVKPLDRFLWEEKPKFSRNIRKWYLDIEILRDENGQYCSPAEATNKIASITFYDSFIKKYYVFLLTDKKDSLKKDNRYIYCFRDETEMLKGFITAVDQLQPDYFTGWNVIGFDMPYLINRIKNLGLEKNDLSPGWYVDVNVREFKNNINYDITIKGRGIIDLMEISKQFWLGTDVGYSLEAQSQKFLGEGKIKIGDIDKAYKQDFWHFVDYNVKDVELCVRLDEKKRLIADMQEFQDIISINLNDTLIAGKIINYYMKQNTSYVLDNANPKIEFNLPGGYVHPVSKGIYKNVHKFDFASHYPAIIRTFNISTDTIVYEPTEEQKKDLYHFKCKYRLVDEEGTKGWQIILEGEKLKGDEIDFEVWFRKDIRGAITKITDELTTERLKMKRSGNKSRSTVLKRMINSIFGQFGFIRSRFFNKDCAIAITLIGQYLTKSIIKEIELQKKGKILMGDTDSFAVNMYNSTKQDIFECANKIFDKSKVNHNLDKNYSELELEAVMEKMILFGVKKKYAQKLLNDPKPKIQGLEIIRKDFPEAIKEFQRKIIEGIFNNDDFSMKNLREIRKEVEDNIRKAINDKNYLYFAMPTSIKKGITEYESNTAEKKALANSKLKISINETFYILYCQGDIPLAFKNIEELDKIPHKVDYDTVISKIFNNIGIFEGLFYKQQSLLEY